MFFEPFVSFTKLQCITALTSVLWMCCKCSKRTLKANRNEIYSLQRVSHAHQESEWNTHKHTFLSNNTASIVVHFRDLVRLSSHQQRTVPEFTWTIPQTTLCKQTRVRFTDARSQTAFTSSKRTELWRQSNPGVHQKCWCESTLRDISTLGHMTLKPFLLNWVTDSKILHWRVVLAAKWLKGVINV